MKPMLAATMKDPNLIGFPVFSSPKLDGIRVLIHPDLGPVTRSLKPLPNLHIRKLLDRPEYAGLDGEIIVGGHTELDAFNATQSGVMSPGGTPEFTLVVFDSFLTPDAPYRARMVTAKAVVNADTTGNLAFVDTRLSNNFGDLTEFELESLDKGYEGLMFRDPQGPYKFGRSTERAGTLVKVKQFDDAEATIVGIQYLNENHNEATTNLLGRTERSTHKAGKVEDLGRVGALLVKGIDAFDGVEFGIGTGFTAALRQSLALGENLIGKTVTYKYQSSGSKDAPRFPVFKGFREAE